MADVHPSAIVYPGTVLGEGVRVLENAVVGKQPSLGATSTANRDALQPTTIGPALLKGELASGAGRPHIAMAIATVSVPATAKERLAVFRRSA